MNDFYDGYFKTDIHVKMKEIFSNINNELAVVLAIIFVGFFFIFTSLNLVINFYSSFFKIDKKIKHFLLHPELFKN